MIHIVIRNMSVPNIITNRKFGSVFSGIGGFDKGLEDVGWTPTWQCENDPDCIDILEDNWPEVMRHGDIRKTQPNRFSPIDLLCAGWPCKGYTTQGSKRGITHPETGLWKELIRIVQYLHPQWLLLENVRNLLSCNGGQEMATVLGDLEECGYWWAYRLFDIYPATWQSRERVIIVARLGKPVPLPILFKPPSVEDFGQEDVQEGQAMAPIVVRLANTSSNGWGIRVGGPAYTLDGTPGCAVAYQEDDSQRAREIAGVPRRLDSIRYRLIGNSVPVPLISFIGKRILDYA